MLCVLFVSFVDCNWSLVSSVLNVTATHTHLTLPLSSADLHAQLGTSFVRPTGACAVEFCYLQELKVLN
jgi:hypothetical protein